MGTVGPAPSGTDYTLGWQLANQLQVPVVDEHYYEKPDWFLLNSARYDGYDRSKSKVYVGEYASWGNSLLNALSEAAYMTSLERNGDIVQMASYAPLLANSNHISWSPDLIYFTNTTLTRSINYYVQQLFSANQGAVYFGNRVSFKTDHAVSDSTLAASCTKDLVSGDIIPKIVNAGSKEMLAQADLSGLGIHAGKAAMRILSGKPEQVNTVTAAVPLTPSLSTIQVTANFSYTAPAYSLSVIRVKTGKQ